MLNQSLTNWYTQFNPRSHVILLLLLVTYDLNTSLILDILILGSWEPRHVCELPSTPVSPGWSKIMGGERWQFAWIHSPPCPLAGGSAPLLQCQLPPPIGPLLLLNCGFSVNRVIHTFWALRGASALVRTYFLCLLG